MFDNSKYAIAFGKSLYELRLSHDLTQRQLGKIIGVSGTTISKYEWGQSEPSFEHLFNIRQYFNTSISQMIGIDYYDCNSINMEYESVKQLAIERNIKPKVLIDIINIIVGYKGSV